MSRGFALGDEVLLRELFVAAPTAMVLVTADGRIRMANRAAEVLFGYGDDGLTGLEVEVLVPVHYRDLHPLWRQKYAERPTRRLMGEGRDLRGLRRDGSEVPIEIGLNPIPAAAGPMVLAAIVDLSQRVRLEQSLRTAVEDRETLLREVHHRVKNNLQVVSSMLSMQARFAGDATLGAAIGDCRDRVRSMALIHEKLYRSDNLTTIEFAHYLTQLATMLVQSHAPHGNVDLVLRCDPVNLHIDSAVPCALIAHELVTNALKHAFGQRRHGRLEVVLRRDPAGVHLHVTDDGPGLPPDFDLQSERTLGVRIVRSLLRQLDGTLRRADDGAAAFTLTFQPVTTARPAAPA